MRKQQEKKTTKKATSKKRMTSLRRLQVLTEGHSLFGTALKAFCKWLCCSVGPFCCPRVPVWGKLKILEWGMFTLMSISHHLAINKSNFIKIIHINSIIIRSFLLLIIAHPISCSLLTPALVSASRHTLHWASDWSTCLAMLRFKEVSVVLMLQWRLTPGNDDRWWMRDEWQKAHEG